jgi:hypothetical protein
MQNFSKITRNRTLYPVINSNDRQIHMLKFGNPANVSKQLDFQKRINKKFFVHSEYLKRLIKVICEILKLGYILAPIITTIAKTAPIY